LIQVIIIIDLAYLWGTAWADRYSLGKQFYAWLLIGGTIINYVLAIAVNIYGYMLSSEHACQNYPNILSSIMIAVIFGVQLLNYNKQNSLLATSALTIFTCYWMLSAVYSGSNCNQSVINS